MRKIHKIVGVGLAVIMSLVTVPTAAMAASAPTPAPDSEVRHEDLSIQPANPLFEDRTDGFYYWRVTSKTVVGYPYGGWRNGPSGRGPATISIGKASSSSYDFSVTNTITGSYTSAWSIAQALGVTIGKSKTYSVSYSLNVPRGKKYQIRYRPQFKKYKVVQTQYYKIDGKAHKTGTKTSYVKVFSNWDYSWRAVR